MKKINTIDAIGHVLCHDITRIIKDEVKDTPFRKGHIVKEEDIPVLLSLGKEHLYVWEQREDMLHENDAAEILYSLCENEYMHPSEIKEGKIEVIGEIDGMLDVDVERLCDINETDEIMISTRSRYSLVKKNEKLAGMRVIPLMVKKAKMQEVKQKAGEKPLLCIRPFVLKTAGVVTTGSEVYHGRIKDTFTPVIVEKLKEYGIEVCMHAIVDDKPEQITQAIQKMKENHVDMILCTGGMSVDPDDVTPLSIRLSGANIVSYGAPVLPGAMFLLGYFEDDTPVIGLPGCVMYAKATVFDLCLPRIACGIKLTKKDIAKLGNGGFCMQCKECHYPNCGFGKEIL